MVLISSPGVGQALDHSVDPVSLPISEAVQLQLNVDQLQQQATATLNKSSRLRKEAKSRQYAVTKITDPQQKTLEREQVKQLAEEVDSLRQQGRDLREQSAGQSKLAQSVLQKEMIHLWQDLKLENKNFVGREAASQFTTAHNTVNRSANPRMPESNTVRTTVEQSMTLEVATVMGQNRPAELDLSRFQFSRDRNYMIHLEAVAGDEGQKNIIPLNTLHQWRLYVANSSGAPAENLSITFSGHMPGHVHGLPTQPRIAEGREAGVYIVSGVKLQMSGWWLIELEINHDDIKDIVSFNVTL